MAVKFQGGKAVPMNPQQFRAIDYVATQLLQAYGRLQEQEKVLRQNGRAAAAAKIGNAARMVKEEYDLLYEQLANN